MSQQIPAKFHRDRSTFGEMMAENLFSGHNRAQPFQCMAVTGKKYLQ